MHSRRPPPARSSCCWPIVGGSSGSAGGASQGIAAVGGAGHPATGTSVAVAMGGIVPAVLWFVASLDEVTISAPGWVHLVTQIIAAALPSIVCLAAGHLADWHRNR